MLPFMKIFFFKFVFKFLTIFYLTTIEKTTITHAQPDECVYGSVLCDLFNATSLTSDWVNSYKDPIQPVGGLPIAFGDINSDHLVDLLFVTGDGKKLELLQGRTCVDGKNILSYFGSRNCLFKQTAFKCSFEYPIVNVAVSDFTGSNNADLLVTLRNENNLYDIHLVTNSLHTRSFSGLICNDSQTLINDATIEPLVLDYNGDMISDILVSTKNCNTFLWTGGRMPEDVNLEDFHLGMTVEQMKKYVPPARYDECLKNLTDQTIISPHSSAFVNLNDNTQDLTPDIFINAKDQIEYILNTPSLGFQQKVSYPYPKETLRGQSFFIDLDYNGRLEHVIPVCLDKKANTFDECVNVALMVLNTDTKTWENLLDNDELTNRSLTFANIEAMGLNIPVTMRVADLDYDGYPDLVTILKDRETGKTFGATFVNKKLYKNGLKNSFGRYFKLEWTSECIEKNNVVVIALFDLYNNGLIYLLLTTLNSDGHFTTYSYDYFTILKKSFYYSFLRVSVIGGRCSNKGPYLDVCPDKDSLAFGAGPPGVAACFNGPYTNQDSCSSQLSQSAHFALQLPYMIFGLGDILNVIHNLRVSIANGQAKSSIGQWEENIPGSNLVVVPYPLTKPNRWEIRVFINMSVYSLISIAFLFVLCLVLLISIYVFYRIEVWEDREDKRWWKELWLNFGPNRH